VAVVSGRLERNLPVRPDDAAGEGFALKLAAMKRRVAKRKAPPVAKPDFQWFLEGVEPGAAEEWLMSAVPPGFRLEAVKMKEDFLATQPLDAPRISWCVFRDKNDYLTLVMGGQAPTWQVAQARAEAIWRIAANIREDA
jgi:hypothetical protein